MENLPTLRSQEKTHFANSNDSQVAIAIKNGLKIRNLEEDEPLLQVLRYVFTLIGIRNEQIPNQLEKVVLVKFIKDHYPNYSVEEIRVAFEFAIKKITTVEVNHYGNFSGLYFASIMEAYQGHRNKVAIELRRIEQRELAKVQKELSDAEILIIENEYKKNIIDPIFEDFKKNNRLDFGITNPKYIYDLMSKEFPYLINLEEKQQIKLEAIARITSKTTEIENQKSFSKEDFKKKKAYLDLIGIPEKAEDLVKQECYCIAVKRIFNHKIEAENGEAKTD
jgi:hypothetical protein